MTPEEINRAIEAAKHMDWQQVVLNGGPPCFHLMSEGRFCGRAQRWEGHPIHHRFVSLDKLLRTINKWVEEKKV